MSFYWEYNRKDGLLLIFDILKIAVSVWFSQFNLPFHRVTADGALEFSAAVQLLSPLDERDKLLDWTINCKLICFTWVVF